jgi:hypothetical protein
MFLTFKQGTPEKIMPEELKSFLISVSIILTIALFIPCIESITKLIRRNSQQQSATKLPEIKSQKSFRKVA